MCSYPTVESEGTAPMGDCPKCGRTFSGDEEFCTKCGVPLQRPAAAASAGGVHVLRGDTGADHSQTHIDGSTHSTQTANTSTITDDHSSSSWNYSPQSVSQVSVKDAHRTITKVKHGTTTISGTTAAVGVALVAIVAVVAVVALRPLGGGAPASDVSVQTPSSTAVSPSAPEQRAPSSEPSANAGASDAAEGRDQPTSPVITRPTASATTAVDRFDPAAYVNTGLAGAGARAVLIVDERSGVDPVLTQQVAHALGASDSLFKPAFVADGLFGRAHRGDVDVLRRLGLDGIDAVLLGVRSATIATQVVAGEQLTRATVTLTFRVVSPADGFTARLVAAREIGAGFDAAQALSNATESAVKKIVSQLGAS